MWNHRAGILFTTSYVGSHVFGTFLRDYADRHYQNCVGRGSNLANFFVVNGKMMEINFYISLNVIKI